MGGNMDSMDSAVLVTVDRAPDVLAVFVVSPTCDVVGSVEKTNDF